MVMVIAAVLALVFAIVAIAESGPRNWPAWGVIALAAGHLIGQLG